MCAVYGPLERWGSGVESHPRHGCLSAIILSVLSCVLRTEKPSRAQQRVVAVTDEWMNETSSIINSGITLSKMKSNTKICVCLKLLMRWATHRDQPDLKRAMNIDWNALIKQYCVFKLINPLSRGCTSQRHMRQECDLRLQLAMRLKCITFCATAWKSLTHDT
jgi:hypothetical protein